MNSTVAVGTGDGVPRAVWRLRLLAVCLGLTALAFLQDPGLLAIDTKVDLVVDPAGWLSRALHVWDPAGTFGQLQNQAYGYLWPMGSFFLAGKLLTIPAWVIQRLWWSLVMTVAFTGVVKLAEKLGIGTPWARIIAGVAFALSPRLLTELGPISVEAWPSALAPWVLVPLIALRDGAPIRRAVTRSALVVACAGGVNATAVLAVVPLAAIWLLGLHPVRLRLRALLGWGIAVACATAWWVIPLLLLGRYSPPFLDYIETAAVTTAPTDLVSVLRGASHWHAYLGGSFGAAWTAGWRLATERPLIIATLVVAGLGVAGLARRGIPHRWFLITGLLAGLALVGFGHVGAVGGLFAESQQAFLDGAGAPLRNVHKFDVVLRLPLILGLTHLLGLALRAAATGSGEARDRARLRAGVVTGVALTAVAAVAAPALGGGLAAHGSFHSVPGYWREASTWLDRHLDQEHVLVVPGSRFPRYLWGSPSDEITQPLLNSRWGVRNSIPLTPPATIRLLDAIDGVLSSGAGSPGLADLLSRSGVRYLLLRSDLDYGRSGATQPMIVRQALLRSAGMSMVTGFGPYVGGGSLPDTFVDNGLNPSVRALEVWEVNRPVQPVTAYDASSLTTVVGGPESVLSAAAAGALPAGPTVLAHDRPADLPAGPVLLTDGMRRKEVAFGLAHDSASATMTAAEQPRLGAPARDYLPAGGDGIETSVRYTGIEAVSAASSFADAQPLSGARPAYQPYAALDGDPGTSWRSAPGTFAPGQWLEVRLPSPRVVRELTMTFDLGADSVPRRISVWAGANKPVGYPVNATTVTVPLTGIVPTDRIRITVDEVLDVRFGYGGVGIAELVIPGVTARRTLAVPPSPVPGRAAGMVFAAAQAVPACYFDAGRVACSGDLARGSEDGTLIDRTATVPVSTSYEIGVRARARPGAALNALLDAGGAAVTTGGITPTVTASSIGVPEPAARPGAAVDGDSGTAWHAADEDEHPWLRLTWPSARPISGVRIRLLATTASSRPSQVTVLGDDDVRNGFLDEGGSMVFDRPMVTDEITVLVSDTVPARSYDPYRNVHRALPVAVGEFTALPDAEPQRFAPDTKLTLRCGSGPVVDVNGVKRTTALVASRRDLVEMREVPAQLCGRGAAAPIPVNAGPARIVASASALATPVRLSLTPAAAGQGAGLPTTETDRQTPVEVKSWGPTLRRVQLDAYRNARVLSLRENQNPGWEATIKGRTLKPLVMDGWQQGWLVPAGFSGDVVLRFAPDTAYSAAIGGGALLLGGVAVAAMLPVRRSLLLPGLPARRWRRLLAALIGGAALLAVGGTAAGGLALLGIAAVVTLRTLQPQFGTDDRQRLRRAVGWADFLLPVVLFTLAGWLTLSTTGHTAALPQLAALAAATGLWLSVVLGRGGRGQRWLRRWKGRSTT
ncbi:alpha-(1-_3)-arabinofuranosyltransferase [Actinoplanes auranticolor]|uniref:alpha-(1->3)-arabinofuranosyltransferase n=1 Tax=Actinoplanes auranticolor TaxID=47988 RepID=UPI001BB40761|nr:alpha-(1->3)-arabinofuranosyltransferase [Actinoplanes auranticolor]